MTPSAPTPFLMIGAAGRMGRAIIEAAVNAGEPYLLAGALEAENHPLIGREVAETIPGAPEGIRFGAVAPESPPAGTVAISFALPEATLAHVESWCVRLGRPMVIGTTGFDDAGLAAIRAAALKAPIVLSPNMSVGVNVLVELVRQAVKSLGESFDIEIHEMHHRHKRDAPSGTARRLAEAALEARGGDYARDVRHGREGLPGPRTRGELGMHCLRGGDVVGDHTVILAADGERVELTHKASSRETFARGALRAAAWLAGKPAGLYTMKEVLSL